MKQVMEQKKQETGIDIASTIMEMPRGFKVGERWFYLYPVTLGKTFLIARPMATLGINAELLKLNPGMEILRLCREKGETVCRILAYHTMQHKEELFDSEAVQARVDLFVKELDDAEKAQLLLLALSGDDVAAIMRETGIEEEKKWQAKVMRAKKDHGSLIFGGKSIYGTLIDTACQRYGWTYDYVVWGIGYANLQLMLADSITSVYLTEKDRKCVNVPQDRNIIRADDPANFARIRAMMKNGDI